MPTTDRYRLHGYVDAEGLRSRNWLLNGRVTFQWIYQNRPNECRYALVSVWDREAHGRYYAVFDLFNVLKTAANELVTPEPRWTHIDRRAAVMTTVLMYNDMGGDHGEKPPACH